jgi:hypothetical protein
MRFVANSINEPLAVFAASVLHFVQCRDWALWLPVMRASVFVMCVRGGGLCDWSDIQLEAATSTDFSRF